MPPINCEINLNLTWSENCLISSATGVETLAITDTKFYVPVVTLSTQDDSKLLQPLQSGFKRTSNWHKYQFKVSIQATSPYLDHLIVQGVNRIFVLSFENNTDRTVHRGYYLPKVEINNYNVMINRQFFFDQQVKNNLRTYDDILKIATGQGDECLANYNYFNKYCKMITIDLSKQQALDPDPEAIQQIKFKGNLNRKDNQVRNINENTTIFFIIEESKEKNFRFSTRKC